MEERIDANNNAGREPLAAFLQRYGPDRGQQEWERAEKVPLEEVRTDTNVYPPNAIVMDDTQIKQSAKGGLKGGQKKVKCRKVIPSSCTAFATT